MALNAKSIAPARVHALRSQEAAESRRYPLTDTRGSPPGHGCTTVLLWRHKGRRQGQRKCKKVYSVVVVEDKIQRSRQIGGRIPQSGMSGLSIFMS